MRRRRCSGIAHPRDTFQEYAVRKNESAQKRGTSLFPLLVCLLPFHNQQANFLFRLCILFGYRFVNLLRVFIYCMCVRMRKLWKNPTTNVRSHCYCTIHTSIASLSFRFSFLYFSSVMSTEDMTVSVPTRGGRGGGVVVIVAAAVVVVVISRVVGKK